MRIATFLPHVRVFGGVRRFLELGNAWVRQGHDVTLYHPDGDAPTWLPYLGRVARLDGVIARADLALCADSHTFAAFRRTPAERLVYYCVLEKDPGLAAAIADRTLLLAANSGPLRRRVARESGRPVLDGIGGINLEQFAPGPAPAHDVLRVLLYGRRSRPKKGTDLVLAALRGLHGRVPPFDVVAFDHVEPGEKTDPRDGAPSSPHVSWHLNPSQDELVALYRSSDVFVAAERKAGWCNTALEAMACGCAVVCTRSGTSDFARHGTTAWVVPVRHPWFLRRGIRRVLEDAAVRRSLRAAGPAAAAPWSWERLATKLIEQVSASRLGLPIEACAPGAPR